ncbi:MAG: hypothetical protein JSR59_20420 [Proteobacteria bacterium]|nr:hypothetical protein [Pseudomonadota bacterium]
MSPPQANRRPTVTGIALALGGVVLALAAALAWLLLSDASDVPPSSMPVAQVAETASPPAEHAAVPSPAATPPGPAASPPCPHQHLEVTSAGGRVQTTCVSVTQTSQSGSVRTYRVEPEGVSRWALRVRVVEGRVIGVRLSAPPGAPGAPPQAYGCMRDDCARMSLGPPDAHGVRRLASQQLPLRALPAAPASAPLAASVPRAPPEAWAGALRLTALLETPPDRQTALACPTSSLGVVDSGGPVVDFCPLGGAGFEVADDGRLRYRFDDLEGRHLVIGMATDGSIDTITLGELGCAMPACGGVTTSSPGGDAEHPGAQRTFAFSGTTLRASGPSGRSAALNGSVVMPPQDP